MIRPLLLVSLWMMLSASSGSLAIDTVIDPLDTEIRAEKWTPLEIRFTAQPPANPFGVDLRVAFSQEGREVINVPGFYDGAGRFAVRFTAPSEGVWRYSVKSSLPELNEQQGKVAVAAPGPDRHGGINVHSQSPRRFQFASGKRYVPIAFEVDWLFALDAENDEGIPLTKTFVDQVAENGFNQVIMNVFAYDVRWPKDPGLKSEHEFGSPRVFPFGGSNDSPKHSELNVEYFQRLDRVIEYLDQKNIAAHLMIYVWNKQVNWPEARSAADNQYFDYVVKRYSAYPNVIWDISKEALGYGHTDVSYITDRIERLREIDPYQRLVTVHDYGYCRRFTENVDFVSVQLWLSELYGVMRKVCEDMPGKPILNIEHGGYERGPYVVFNGNYTSPETCLERAYQCLFAGTFPTHYWQGSSWNVIVPDPQSLPSEQRPRLEYYRHMSDLVERFSLDELVSGQRKSNAGFSLHNDRDFFVFYVPSECEFFGVRLPKDARGENMTLTWFDPFAGTYSTPIEATIEQWPKFLKPGDGFRILILRISEATDGQIDD